MIALLSAILFTAAPVATQVDEIIIDRDNVRITNSCTVRIPRDVIEDADGNGVIQIHGNDIEIDFAGERLHGAAQSTSPDQYAGFGVVISGRNVTIRNLAVSGFKGGIYASSADGLLIEDCDISGNFRQRLGSTPKAEDGADWLWPHNNEGNEWLENYGAGLYIEESNDVTIRRVRAREGQNGILLDTVTGSKIYDNDCSFLSGWGLGMWRCERNTISRNAFDFCVRGYSHGVYNRGQDSAGILLFEQNNDNVFAENSATHGGDGVFAFAGREALGEHEPREDLAFYERRGNSRNIFIGNDLSYAAAHGLELTFSFDNFIIANRMVENAICGIWGGYSQFTEIRDNHFEGNGEGAYGMERGGINIEHGHANRILDNTFADNKCGVFLWWDADEGLMSRPWAKANEKGSSDNIIVRNSFAGDLIAIQLRLSEDTLVARNTFSNVGEAIDVDEESRQSISREPDRPVEPIAVPEFSVYGETSPVGARMHLRGREHIIITEWGPYDWQSPYLQRLPDEDGAHVYRLLGGSEIQNIGVDGPIAVRLNPERTVIRVEPKIKAGIIEYLLVLDTPEGKIEREDVIVDTTWNVRFFNWTTDPRDDVDSWREEAKRSGVTLTTQGIDFPFGGGGPSALTDAPVDLSQAQIGGEQFGTIASTTVTFPAGTWRIVTDSDDGIRVWVGNTLIIDDWTWHPPKRITAEVSFEQPTRTEIRVEHFELTGHAVLAVDIEPGSD